MQKSKDEIPITFGFTFFRCFSFRFIRFPKWFGISKNQIFLLENLKISIRTLYDAEKELEDEPRKNFLQAFIASISVILVSEIADKTFFIAAIMAAQYNRVLVFLGAMSALLVMTALSAAFGSVATLFLRVEITQLISNILFVLFGLKSLTEGIKMKKNEDTEFKETDAELKEADENAQMNAKGGADAESGQVASEETLPFHRKCLRTFFNRIYLQAFTMTFLAEWGDRSQITTVILATRDDPYGVALGGCIGHFICTGFAVLGGRLIAQKISVRSRCTNVLRSLYGDSTGTL